MKTYQRYSKYKLMIYNLVTFQYLYLNNFLQYNQYKKYILLFWIFIALSILIDQTKMSQSYRQIHGNVKDKNQTYEKMAEKKVYQLSDGDKNFIHSLKTKYIAGRETRIQNINDWSLIKEATDFRKVIYDLLQSFIKKNQQLTQTITDQSISKNTSLLQQKYALIIQFLGMIDVCDYQGAEKFLKRKNLITQTNFVGTLRSLLLKTLSFNEVQKNKQEIQRQKQFLNIYDQVLQKIDSPKTIQNLISSHKKLGTLDQDLQDKLQELSNIIKQKNDSKVIIDYYDRVINSFNKQIKTNPLTLKFTQLTIQQFEPECLLTQSTRISGKQTKTKLLQLLDNIKWSRGKALVTEEIKSLQTFQQKRFFTFNLLKSFLALNQQNFCQNKFQFFQQNMLRQFLKEKQIISVLNSLKQHGKTVRIQFEFSELLKNLQINKPYTIKQTLKFISQKRNQKVARNLQRQFQKQFLFKVICQIDSQRHINDEFFIEQVMKILNPYVNKNIIKSLTKIRLIKQLQKDQLVSFKQKLREIQNIMGIQNPKINHINNNPNLAGFHHELNASITNIYNVFKINQNQLSKIKGCSQKKNNTQKKLQQGQIVLSQNNSMNISSTSISDIQKYQQSLNQKIRQIDLMKSRFRKILEQQNFETLFTSYLTSSTSGTYNISPFKLGQFAKGILKQLEKVDKGGKDYKQKEFQKQTSSQKGTQSLKIQSIPQTIHFSRRNQQTNSQKCREPSFQNQINKFKIPVHNNLYTIVELKTQFENLHDKYNNILKKHLKFEEQNKQINNQKYQLTKQINDLKRKGYGAQNIVKQLRNCQQKENDYSKKNQQLQIRIQKITQQLNRTKKSQEQSIHQFQKFVKLEKNKLIQQNQRLSFQTKQLRTKNQDLYNNLNYQIKLNQSISKQKDNLFNERNSFQKQNKQLSQQFQKFKQLNQNLRMKVRQYEQQTLPSLRQVHQTQIVRIDQMQKLIQYQKREIQLKQQKISSLENSIVTLQDQLQKKQKQLQEKQKQKRVPNFRSMKLDDNQANKNHQPSSKKIDSKTSRNQKPLIIQKKDTFSQVQFKEKTLDQAYNIFIIENIKRAKGEINNLSEMNCPKMDQKTAIEVQKKQQMISYIDENFNNEVSKNNINSKKTNEIQKEEDQFQNLDPSDQISVQSAKKQNDELNELKLKLANLQRNFENSQSELKRKVERVQFLQVQTQRLSRQTKNVELAKNYLELKLKQVQNELEKAKQIDINRLQSFNKESISSIQKLTKQLEAQKQTYQKQISELRKQFQDQRQQEKEKIRLKDQDYKRSMHQLQTKNNQLSEKLQKKSEQSVLIAKKKESQQSKEEFRFQLDQKQKNPIQNILIDLNNEGNIINEGNRVRQIQLKLQSTEENLKKMQILMKDWKVKAIEYEMDLMEEKQQHKTLRDKYKKQISQYKEKVEQISKLQNDYKSQIQTLSKQLNEAKTSSQSFEIALRNTQSKSNEMSSLVMEKDKTIDQMTQQMNRLQNKIQALSKTLSERQTQIRQQSQSLRSMRKANSAEIQKVKKECADQIKKLKLQNSRKIQEKESEISQMKMQQRINSIPSSSGQSERFGSSDSSSQLKLELGKISGQLQKAKQLLNSRENQLNQLKSERQSFFKQLKKNKEEIQSLNYQVTQLENEAQQYRFNSSLNSSRINIEESSTNKNVVYDRFFAGEALDQQYDRKYNLFNLLKSKNQGLAVKKTRLLYRFDQLNPTNFHSYVDKIPNILIIVRTIKGHVFGAFSSAKYQQKSKQSLYTVSFLFTFKSDKLESFDINYSRNNAKSLTYDDYFLIVGNSQIRLRFGEKSVYSNFGINNGYYDTRGIANVNDLLDANDARQIQIATFEVFEVQFEKR